MRISDWGSDVCSSDLDSRSLDTAFSRRDERRHSVLNSACRITRIGRCCRNLRGIRASWIIGGARGLGREIDVHRRSEEHTSELQSLMRISYAVFCLKKKKITKNNTTYTNLLLNN